MYARRLTMQIHQNETGEFTRAMESEILPLMRKQPGFRDEIVLVNPKAAQAESITIWNSQEYAETFGKGPYLDVLKVLGKVIKDKPQLQSFEVSNSTIHLQAKGSTA